jgi:hypothetical protein
MEQYISYLLRDQIEDPRKSLPTADANHPIIGKNCRVTYSVPQAFGVDVDDESSSPSFPSSSSSTTGLSSIPNKGKPKSESFLHVHA